MAMKRKHKIIVGILAVVAGIGIFLIAKKSKAGNGGNGGGGGAIFIPPGSGGVPAPELDAAPIPIVVGIPSAENPLSELETDSSDPLKVQGWSWEYIGAVDSSQGTYSIGEQIPVSSLPFSAVGVAQITPLTSIAHAYYVGLGQMLVRGYYLIGPMKNGYGFQAGAWGVVEVWNPTWHGH